MWTDAPSLSTSTWVPSMSSRPCHSPTRSSRLRPGPISTRRPTSLSGSASPLAAEPNTRNVACAVLRGAAQYLRAPLAQRTEAAGTLNRAHVAHYVTACRGRQFVMSAHSGSWVSAPWAALARRARGLAQPVKQRGPADWQKPRLAKRPARSGYNSLGSSWPTLQRRLSTSQPCWRRIRLAPR